MPFYIQNLSLLNRWHFTEAINIQRAFQDGERKTTKIWQHSPLSRPREKLGSKGSCQAWSKFCCDTAGKRINLKNGSVLNYKLFGLHLQWKYLISESGKYWGKKKEQAFKFCKHFWFSEMLLTHYPFPFCWISGSLPSLKNILWYIYLHVLCYCELPCYQV